MKVRYWIVATVLALIIALPMTWQRHTFNKRVQEREQKIYELNEYLDGYETKSEEQKQIIEEKVDQIELKDQEIEKLKQDLQSKREKEVEQKRVAEEQQLKKKLATAKYSGGGNCEAYRGLLSQYSWNIEVAMAVMKAESGCNPQAANHTDNHKVCKGSFGLMQISCHSGAIYDPAQNISIAWQKYQARGWQPWGAFTSGAYKRYL